MSTGIPIPFVDRIFAPMREQLGGRVRLMVCGGASLHPEIQDFMAVCMGVRVIQGYGLTECCGPVSVQEITDYVSGSIGAPIPCLEFKLIDVPEMGYTSEDKPSARGEICIRGPSVFRGYLHNEEETKKAIDADGWFHTGDVGMWVANGTLRIIDRVKNLIKPSHGEYIALEKLEAIYRTCPLIDNIVIYADSHHFDVVGIVTPNKQATEQWAKQNSVGAADFAKKIKEQILKALLQTAQQHGLKSIEFVRAVHVADEEWTAENGLLTAAQKIKRKPIVDKHQAEISAMYKSLESK
jgi:long-chain acyl-CoA synthetase